MTTWCSPHMKTITVSLYRNYSKMVITCFAAEDTNNNFRYGKYNYGTWLKKNPAWSTHVRLSGVVDRATTNCFPLHYISLRCSQPIFSLVSNFFVKHPNCHYFYIVKYYVRHTNWYGYTMYTLFILFMGYCPCDLMFINYESVPVLDY